MTSDESRFAEALYRAYEAERPPGREYAPLHLVRRHVAREFTPPLSTVLCFLQRVYPKLLAEDSPYSISLEVDWRGSKPANPPVIDGVPRYIIAMRPRRS